MTFTDPHCNNPVNLLRGVDYDDYGDEVDNDTVVVSGALVSIIDAPQLANTRAVDGAPRTVRTHLCQWPAWVPVTPEVGDRIEEADGTILNVMKVSHIGNTMVGRSTVLDLVQVT
jgi:hypothetical protein